MNELDKLEKYLREHNYIFQRIEEPGKIGRHQIIVYRSAKCDEDDRSWDAICHYGSYGYEQGLLEIMGSDIVEPHEGCVVGYLTADEVIGRLER